MILMAQAITNMDKTTQDKLLKAHERAERRRLEGIKPNKKQVERMVEGVRIKICNGPCKKWVKLTDFHVNNATRDGRVTICKVCRSKIPQKRKPIKTYNDKPIKCSSCVWTGIEADLDNGLCPDCQNKVGPIYFGTIQDSLKALKEIGQEMMPQM